MDPVTALIRPTVNFARRHWVRRSKYDDAAAGTVGSWAAGGPARRAARGTGWPAAAAGRLGTTASGPGRWLGPASAAAPAGSAAARPAAAGPAAAAGWLGPAAWS